MEPAELRELAGELFLAVKHGRNLVEIGDHLRHSGAGDLARAFGEELSPHAPRLSSASPEIRAAREKVRGLAGEAELRGVLDDLWSYLDDAKERARDIADEKGGTWEMYYDPEPDLEGACMEIAAALTHHGVSADARAFGYELGVICASYSHTDGQVSLEEFEKSKKALAVELGLVKPKADPSQAVLACFGAAQGAA